MGKRFKKAALFTALAFVLSWSFIYLYFALGGQWVLPQALLIGVIYMYMPAAAAIIVQKGVFRQPVLKGLNVRLQWNRWFAAAWLLPIALALLLIPVALLIPGVEFSPDMGGLLERLEGILSPQELAEMEEQLEAFPVHLFWISLAQAIVFGITVNAAAAFGEELGWRGLLQNELLPLGFWQASLIIGVIWGLWHAPLILQGHNYPDNPQWGVLMMIVFTTLITPLFTYITCKAKSVIAASIFHGSVNAGTGLSLIVLSGSDLIVGFTGAAGFLVLIACNAGMIVYDRRQEQPLLQGAAAPNRPE